MNEAATASAKTKSMDIDDNEPLNDNSILTIQKHDGII